MLLPGPEGGGSNVGDEPGVPLEHTPTIPTKQDVLHYLGILAPLTTSFQEHDLMGHTVYMDPAHEHDRYQELLDKASEIDGCYQGFDCAGWRKTSDEALDSLESLAAVSSVAAMDRIKAAVYRRRAWDHYVNFRYMEQRMTERCGEPFCLTKQEISTENQIWRDWESFRARFTAFALWAKDTLAVKDSDFQDVQRFDLELQKFRQRYRAATGYAPSTPWPTSAPEEGTLMTLGAALKMITGAAVVLGGVYVATQMFSRRDAAAPGSVQHPDPSAAPELAPAAPESESDPGPMNEPGLVPVPA